MFKADLEELVTETGAAKDRISYLFQDQEELRTNIERWKSDYKQLKQDMDFFKQKVIVIEQHHGIYFDAYR